MKVRRTWNGDELKVRANRANGRGILGMGEGASVAMATVAHVISGDLKRSIHVAKLNTMGEPPVEGGEEARTGETNWQIEVGSWLPYACVENNRGGSHRFADIGWSAAEPEFDAKLALAWREEGL